MNKFSVHKYGGCAGDLGLTALIHVSINDILYGRIVQVAVEGIHIELEILGDILYCFIVQTVSQLKQLVMKFQKFSLLVRRKSGSGSLSSEGMHGEGKVLENELYLFRIFLQQLPEERLNPRTVWSLVVAENHKGDCGLLRALVRQSFQGKMLDNR